MQVFFTSTPFVPIYMAELNFEIQTSNFDRDFRHTNFKFFEIKFVYLLTM